MNSLEAEMLNGKLLFSMGKCVMNPEGEVWGYLKVSALSFLIFLHSCYFQSKSILRDICQTYKDSHFIFSLIYGI